MGYTLIFSLTNKFTICFLTKRTESQVESLVGTVEGL